MADAARDLDEALIQGDRYRDDGRPVAEWDWLLANDPIHWTEPTGRETFWAITRHRDVVEITKQPELFSSEVGSILILTDAEVEARQRADDQFSGMRTIITMDPPDHGMFRKLAAGYFTPRGIARLHDIVSASADETFAELRADGADSFDFVTRVAEHHSVRVLCAILGIERELEDEILYITDHVFDREDSSLTQEEKDQAAAELGQRTFALFDAIIQDRRANPRDDLATMLATAVLPNGEAMGPAETLGYYLIVFTAGHDTTKFALAGAADLFLDNPAEFQRLRADQSLLMTATEEVVRCIAPVNYAKRTVMADYQLGDVHLREGERVALFYGAANRDPAVFEQPGRFDVGRDPNRHLGFGWAEHYCLGAHLARASIAGVLDVMTTRIESLERAGEPTYSPGTLVHGHKTMPVAAHWA